MYGPREIARVNIGLLGSPASLERKFRPCEAANDGLRNDAVEQLARTVCVRRADHVHGELEKLVNRSEIHVEGDLRRRVGTGRLDRLLLRPRSLHGYVHLPGSYVN